jgi:hypothetical protein
MAFTLSAEVTTPLQDTSTRLATPQTRGRSLPRKCWEKTSGTFPGLPKRR